jgi:hypothetical protein
LEAPIIKILLAYIDLLTLFQIDSDITTPPAANAVPSDQRHDGTTAQTLNGEQYGDTQHYTGSECAPGTSSALKLSPHT